VSTADCSRVSISAWKVSGVQIATQPSRWGVRKQRGPRRERIRAGRISRPFESSEWSYLPKKLLSGPNVVALPSQTTGRRLGDSAPLPSISRHSMCQSLHRQPQRVPGRSRPARTRDVPHRFSRAGGGTRPIRDQKKARAPIGDRIRPVRHRRGVNGRAPGTRWCDVGPCQRADGRGGAAPRWAPARGRGAALSARRPRSRSGGSRGARRGRYEWVGVSPPRRASSPRRRSPVGRPGRRRRTCRSSGRCRARCRSRRSRGPSSA